MNELQIFNNNEFGDVRTVMVDDKPYFVGSDIAKALGYKNISRDIQRHCKGVNSAFITTNGGNQKMLIITESDVFSLIERSRTKTIKFKESFVKYLQDKGYLKEVVLTSRQEIEFIECLKSILEPFEIKGESQYPILNYNVDFYIESLNIAIEYDENNHIGYTQEQHEDRQIEIEKESNCTFIRINNKDSHMWNCGYVLKQLIEKGLVK